MATPLPGCAVTPIFELERRVNRRRWVIVPPQGRAQVIAELHEAHPSISKLEVLARGYVW